MKWYSKHGPLGGDPSHPTVAVLLYRKHVITEQMYIGQLIGNMEEQGVRPIPIFINGIEAHTVVNSHSFCLSVYGMASQIRLIGNMKGQSKKSMAVSSKALKLAP